MTQEWNLVLTALYSPPFVRGGLHHIFFSSGPDSFPCQDNSPIAFCHAFRSKKRSPCVFPESANSRISAFSHNIHRKIQSSSQNQPLQRRNRPMVPADSAVRVLRKGHLAEGHGQGIVGQESPRQQFADAGNIFNRFRRLNRPAPGPAHRLRPARDTPRRRRGKRASAARRRRR